MSTESLIFHLRGEIKIQASKARWFRYVKTEEQRKEKQNYHLGRRDALLALVKLFPDLKQRVTSL